MPIHDRYMRMGMKPFFYEHQCRTALSPSGMLGEVCLIIPASMPRGFERYCAMGDTTSISSALYSRLEEHSSAAMRLTTTISTKFGDKTLSTSPQLFDVATHKAQ